MDYFLTFMQIPSAYVAIVESYMLNLMPDYIWCQLRKPN